MARCGALLLKDELVRELTYATVVAETSILTSRSTNTKPL